MNNLLIYIPIYNGSSRIKITLDCLVAAINELPNEHKNRVIVHINDNCSTDDTLQICQKYKNEHNFNIASNQLNLGATYNVGLGLKIDYGQDFTWIIGDDDRLRPNSIVRLFDFSSRLSKDGINVDLFHVNAGYIKPEVAEQENFLEILADGKLNSFWCNNQKFKQPTVCKFPDLIDPKIECSTLSGIMTLIFNSKKVREATQNIDFLSELDYQQGYMSSKRAFPHSYSLILAFSADTICFSDPNLYSVTTYGHQSWKASRSRLFALGGLDFLIKLYDNNILSFDHLLYALNGLAVGQRQEFKDVIFNAEFENITGRYKDILLKAMFYDPPQK